MSVYRVLATAILLISCGVAAFSSAPGSSSGRIIKFPETSIGKLYLRPAGSRLNHIDHILVDILRWNHENPFGDQPQGWREAGDARGSVAISPGQEAMLALQARKDLPSLDQLGSTDLQGLMISDPNPSAEYDKALLRHVSRLTGLRFLAAWGLNLTDADLDFLKPLTALEFLHLGGLQLKGGGLAKLGGLTGLDELSFNGGLGDPREPLPEGALRPLKDLPMLKRLSFAMCRLRAHDLEVLPELPHLEVLNLMFTFIDETGLAHLKDCRALRELDLSSIGIKDEDLALLGGIRTLEKLNLSSNRLTGEGLHSLKTLGRLDTLELMLGSSITDKGLEALGELTSLRNLVLDGNKFTDAGTPALGKLVNLEYLYLGNSSLTDAGAAFLANLKNLRTLILPSGNRMTDHMFAYLQGASRLEKVMTIIRLGDEGLKSLGRLPLVKLPQLDPELISDAGFMMIPRAELVDHFEFGKSKVTDVGLTHLKDLPGVHILNFQQSKITDRGLAAVAVLPNLVELDLTSTSVSDAGLACLAGLRSLKSLKLQGTRISDAGLKSLAGLKGLETLVLQDTAVTDNGIKALEGLEGLTFLGLGQTQVTDAGLAALDRLPQLSVLVLADTAVGDGGMMALGRLKSLTRLNLDGTAVSDEGIKQLAGMSALHVIGLERTRITREGAGGLQQALPKATFLMAESGASEGEKPGVDLPGMIRRTKSGLTLYRCLLEARKRGIALAALPAPTREALREYFGCFIYTDFKPALFWPSYPAHWQEGLRKVHRHALLSGDLNNVLSSVMIAPLLFTPQEMGKIYAPRSMMLAICNGPSYVSSFDYDDEDYDAARNAWIDAAWKQAASRQRSEMVDVFFRKPLASAHDEDKRESHSPYSNRERIFSRAGRVPLRDWLRTNLKQLDSLLHDDNYDVRQGALLLALEKKDDLLLNPLDPYIIRLMIEGLKNDAFRDNQDVYDRLLAQNPEASLPAMRRTFLRTDNGQQKMFLCTMLVYLNDAATRPQQLDYLYGLLAASELEKLPPRQGEVRLDWTVARLVAMDAPAREYLKKKVKTCTDPQQLAFTILVLHALHGAGGIQWNDRLVGILAEGLKTNKVDWDLGVCSAALKLGKPDALAPLKRVMAKKKDDKQFQRAADALCAYYAGDMAGYLKLKDPYGDYPSDTNYWEFGDLSGLTAKAARESIGNIVKEGGAGSEIQDWGW